MISKVFRKQIFIGSMTIISSKTVLRRGSKKEKRSYDKVINNKKTLTILSFFRILYLKHQSNISRCLYSLQLEKSLLSNKFFSFISCSKIIVHTPGKDQIKHFAQD